MDATGIPVVKKETEGRTGKVDGQPAHTREVKLGCVFTQSQWDEEGYALRDPDSTTYTGAVETAGEFGQRIYLEAWNRGWSRAEKKVVMGDGAAWIWNLADLHFPGALQIVDLYHARQHLWGLAPILHPGDEVRQKRWLRPHQPQLDEGQIEKLVGFLRSLHPASPELAEKIQTEAAYFETNAACATRSFAASIDSSVRASSKPDVRRSSARASKNPACSGPCAALTPSSPCAAAI